MQGPGRGCERISHQYPHKLENGGGGGVKKLKGKQDCQHRSQIQSEDEIKAFQKGATRDPSKSNCKEGLPAKEQRLA